MVLVNLVAVAINFCGMQAWQLNWLSAHTNESRTAPHFRLLEMNVEYINTDYKKALELIEREQPDIIVIEELTNVWLANLQPISKAYPYQILAAEESPYGNGILSKLPFQSTKLYTFGPRNHPTLVANFNLKGKFLSLIHTHLPGPISPRSFPMHQLEAEEVRSLLSQCNKNAILCGDMNSSSWSYPLRSIKELAGMKDSQDGHGLQLSWPTQKRFPHFCILSIDHCFVRGNIEVLDRRIGPFIGSDHYPLVVDFVVTEHK